MENRHSKYYQKNDELRARFTGWLNTVIYRAKLRYMERHKRVIATVPIDDVPESFLEYQETLFSHVERTANDFDFEEERLAEAYSSLPLMRREILRLLFVEDLKADEIARRLNCSIQHVYNQRSLALKRLRQLLEKESGDGNDRG
jgi:RNA polymerase sigma factor (sigma-70 family)